MSDEGVGGAHLAISALIANLSKLDPIHSGSRHKLYRGHLSNTRVVVKVTSAESPRDGAVASARHEYVFLRELDLLGIVRAIGLFPAGNGFALLMEDAGETNLAALIEQWVSDAASHHLLVIGAYRDNEVGPSHALALSLAALKGTDRAVTRYGAHVFSLYIGRPIYGKTNGSRIRCTFRK